MSNESFTHTSYLKLSPYLCIGFFISYLSAHAYGCAGLGDGCGNDAAGHRRFTGR
jgi:hypothetical protein